MTRMALLTPRRSATAPVVSPADLGDVLDAEQVRIQFFQSRVSREWVLEHVAPEQKFYMGRAAVWYAGHIRAWMPAFVAQQQQRAAKRRKVAG